MIKITIRKLDSYWSLTIAINFDCIYKKGDFTTKNQIGWVGSFLGAVMYLSQVDQILLNIKGNKGSILLPIVTVINAFLWTSYGSIGERIDWIIVAPNLIGIAVSAVNAFTAWKNLKIKT